jgi:hypothetical protein
VEIKICLRSRTLRQALAISLLTLFSAPAIATTLHSRPDTLVQKFKSFNQCLAYIEGLRAKSASTDHMRAADWKAIKIDGSYQTTTMSHEAGKAEATVLVTAGYDRADRRADHIITGVSSSSSGRYVCRGKRLYSSSYNTSLEI